jgi:nicotinamidase/pyrazinamidase
MRQITMQALLLIDLQQDFFEGGSLAVQGAEKIVPVINDLISFFSLVVASKDWHPSDHVSFTSSLSGASSIQTWPSHCVQNTQGAEFTAHLNPIAITKVFYKGDLTQEESFSAFYKGEHKQSTGLDEFLKSKGVKELYIAGIVCEYCVRATAEDALKKGYRVYLIEDAIASFSPQTKAKVFKELKNQGAHSVLSCNIENI